VKKCGIVLFILLIFKFSFLYAQEIITADRHLELVSNNFAAMRDFEANVAIRSGNMDMAGRLSFKAPSLLRIDFSRPAEQVIVFNGETLTVYVPDMRAILVQNLSRSRRAATYGLSMLRRNYVASFVTSPHPEPLDAMSGERVIKLRLTRRSAAEGFREIIVSINPETRIIRRFEGRTIGDMEVRMDMTNIRVNQGIPDTRFVFDSPGTANYYHNFMFRDD